MNILAGGWAISWLIVLAEWSIRWGVVIAALAGFLIVRPPRSTEVRYLMCLAWLASGFLLPVGPRWGHAAIPWPTTGIPAANESAPSVSSVAESQRDEGPTVPPDADRPDSRDDAQVAALRPGGVRESAGRRRLPTTPRPPGGWRLAALMTTGAWGSVVLALLLRLGGGWLTLARLKREAVDVGRGSARLIDECRAVLGLSRPVRLASHAAVFSPVVIAGAPPLSSSRPTGTTGPSRTVAPAFCTS